MASIVWLTVVLLLAGSSTIEARRKRPRCTKVSIKQCQNLGYNSTVFPNPLTNITSQNITAKYLEFLPWLAHLNCTKLIDPMPFLCFVYVPKCFPKSKKAPKYVIPPCREFCQKAVGDCPRKAKQLKGQPRPVQWPNVLDCASYPEAGSKSCIKDEMMTIAKANKGKKRKEDKIVKLCCNSGKKAARKGYQCSVVGFRTSSTTASYLKSLTQVNKCKTLDQVNRFEKCCRKRKKEQQKKKEQKKKRKNMKQEKKKKRQEKKAENKLRKANRKMKKSQRKSG